MPMSGEAASMSPFTVTVTWQRGSARFVQNDYSRAHIWTFDGGAIVEASSSPHVVPVPYSKAANVDPEEAYVAALSSCHMLFFLSLSASQGLTIDSYVDTAEGHMEKNASGKLWVARVVLRPLIKFQDTIDANVIAQLHHAAHAECFLANSVNTAVTVESA
jgi:organic hydroperoxide reductase OsmC/OhrA